MLKYDPPRIGVKYESGSKLGKVKVKKITLAHLAKAGADPDRVVEDLFRCFPKYFNKKYTSKAQVREMVVKLIEFHNKKREKNEAKSIVPQSSQQFENQTNSR